MLPEKGEGAYELCIRQQVVPVGPNAGVRPGVLARAVAQHKLSQLGGRHPGR